MTRSRDYFCLDLIASYLVEGMPNQCASHIVVFPCLKFSFILISFFKFQKIGPSISVQLLEYDKRFEQYGSHFTFYNYNFPEQLPSESKHAYQVVVADPPYLGKNTIYMSESVCLLALHINVEYHSKTNMARLEYPKVYLI